MDRTRNDLRRPTDVPTTRLRPISMSEVAAEYAAARAAEAAPHHEGAAHDAETVDLSADDLDDAEPLPPAPSAPPTASLQPRELVDVIRATLINQARTHRLPIDERLAGVLAREQAQVLVSLLEERGGLAIE